MKVLIGAGADVNAVGRDGETPLCAAARGEYTDIAKALIEAGADVNAAGRYGDTPLYAAARYGYTGTVKVLVGAGGQGRMSTLPTRMRRRLFTLRLAIGALAL